MSDMLATHHAETGPAGNPHLPDAPTLPSVGTAQPVVGADPQPVAPTISAPTADESSSVFATIPGAAPALPSTPGESSDPAALPTLPNATPAGPVSVGPAESDPDAGAPENSDADAEPVHPMAHLMPAKCKPSEATRKAAEVRAARKAKAKRTKRIVVAVALVFSAAVGPPLWSWLTDALNEVGVNADVDE